MADQSFHRDDGISPAQAGGRGGGEFEDALKGRQIHREREERAGTISVAILTHAGRPEGPLAEPASISALAGLTVNSKHIPQLICLACESGQAFWLVSSALKGF